jgi:hypothetical protein
MRKKVLVVEDDGEIRPGLVDEAEIEPYRDSTSRPLPELDAEKLSAKPKHQKQKRAEEPDRIVASLTYVVVGVVVMLILLGLVAMMLLSRMPRMPMP